MRLTCPNCGAQYEVPDEVIPEAGRDVQCSNCGTTWFQAHPDHPVEAPEPANLDDELAQFAVEPEPEPLSAEKRELTPDVQKILREEAEHEAQMRAAEADGGGLESQPDLGLDDGNSADDLRAREAAERMARMRGDLDPLPDDAAPDLDPGTRRDLLPDIDDINSSLENSEQSRARKTSSPPSLPTAGAPQPARTASFRRGFAVGLLLIVGMIVVYTQAATLAETFPEVDPYLNSYVNNVDAARLWLDQNVSQLLP